MAGKCKTGLSGHNGALARMGAIHAKGSMH